MRHEDCSLREYGDGQHIVAYVEVDHPAYQRVRHFKSMVREVAYFDTGDKGKQIGADFYFYYGVRPSVYRRIKAKLESILGVEIEPARGVKIE